MRHCLSGYSRQTVVHLSASCNPQKHSAHNRQCHDPARWSASPLPAIFSVGTGGISEHDYGGHGRHRGDQGHGHTDFFRYRDEAQDKVKQYRKISILQMIIPYNSICFTYFRISIQANTPQDRSSQAVSPSLRYSGIPSGRHPEVSARSVRKGLPARWQLSPD